MTARFAYGLGISILRARAFSAVGPWLERRHIAGAIDTTIGGSHECSCPLPDVHQTECAQTEYYSP